MRSLDDLISLLKAVKVGKELGIHEIVEVIAGLCFVVVELAVLALGRGPTFPAIGDVEDERVFLALQLGFIGLVLF
jgi:hypothetical protein